MVIFSFAFPWQKRKLSWSNSDDTGRVPTKHNHHRQGKRQRCQETTSPDTVSTRLPLSPKKQISSAEQTAERGGGNCAHGCKFTDRTVPFSRSSHSCGTRENKNQTPLEISPPSSCGSPVTQDSSVSSSNTVTITPSP